MAFELRPEHQRMIDLAIRSGAYRNYAMLVEDVEDGAISKARSAERRYTLAEVEEELRALGKVE